MRSRRSTAANPSSSLSRVISRGREYMHMRFRACAGVACAGVLMLSGVCAARAQTTRYVPQVYSTIQSAINVSNDGDTIVVAPGVYSESLDWEFTKLTIVGAGAG